MKLTNENPLKKKTVCSRGGSCALFNNIPIVISTPENQAVS